MAALVALVASLPLTWWLFGAAVRRRGMPRGYNLAFAGYWFACAAVPVALMGPRRIVTLLIPRAPSVWQAALLALPVAGAVGYAFVPRLAHATLRIVGTSFARASVNAVCEELFWRALFIASFPSSAWLGWIVPAAGFAAWHAAPLRATGGVRSRQAPFLAGAALIGLGYGWVAWRTGSIFWPMIAHTLVDACGLDAARLALGLTNDAVETPRRPAA